MNLATVLSYLYVEYLDSIYLDCVQKVALLSFCELVTLFCLHDIYMRSLEEVCIQEAAGAAELCTCYI